MSFFDDLFGGSNNNKSTTTTGPSGYTEKYLTPGLDQNLANLNAGKYQVPAYPGQTVAGLTPEQLQAQGMGIARATNGSPIVGGAQDYIGDVLSGKYLDQGNPNTQAMIDRTKAQVTDQLSRVGAFGNNNVSARGLAEGIAPILYQDYATQQARMDNAASLAPTLANNDWVDINALNQIGGARQTQTQNEINSDINRYTTNANLPATSLNAYLAMLGGNTGSTTTTTGANNGPTGAQQGVGTGLALLGSLLNSGSGSGSSGWFNW